MRIFLLTVISQFLLFIYECLAWFSFPVAKLDCYSGPEMELPLYGYSVVSLQWLLKLLETDALSCLQHWTRILT